MKKGKYKIQVESTWEDLTAGLAIMLLLYAFVEIVLDFTVFSFLLLFSSSSSLLQLICYLFFYPFPFSSWIPRVSAIFDFICFLLENGTNQDNIHDIPDLVTSLLPNVLMLGELSCRSCSQVN